MVWLATLAILNSANRASGPDGFALKDGDRVVFYGDSITDNAAYTKYAEIFVRTRFPKLNVHFINAGVGGDRVTGGWMGPIDQRLSRDLFSRRPTVITVMLGMNDGGYHPTDAATVDAYENGYRHMVSLFHKEAPSARVWLIEPSPYDDVTRAPNFTDGYNSVMKAYGNFVSDLASQNGYGVVDFNGPIVSVLEKLKTVDEAASQKVVPDRVHPSDPGHLVMAAALVKAWHAPAVVSSVTIDANAGTANAVDSKVSEITKGPNVSWTQLDDALPFAYRLDNAAENLVRSVDPVEDSFGHETVSVQGLPDGNYEVSIDNSVIGKWNSSQLGQGVDLTHVMTPMLKQAQHVSDLVWHREDLRYQAWRNYEFGLQLNPESTRHDIVRAADHLNDLLEAEIREADKPVVHHFEVRKAAD